MAKRAPKLSERQAQAVQVKGLGGEPMFAVSYVLSEMDLVRSYSWYSAVKNWADAKEYLLQYAEKSRPELVSVIRRVPEDKIVTYGWIARMLSRGIRVPQNVEQRFKMFLDQLVNNYPANTNTTKAAVAEATRSDRLSDCIAEFECALDELNPNFSAYEYLNSNQIPQSYATRVREFYMPILSELLTAAEGKDPQVSEGFAHMKKKQIVANAMYVDRFIDDCDRYTNNIKKVRAPRKQKVKKPEQVLRHFKFKAEEQDLKIKSIDPISIVGSSKLFALNTSNNVLTVFVAKEGGLQIHRSSIGNYDPALTKSKRVGKKIGAVIAAVLEGNKKQRDSVLELVSSEYINSSDRINNSIVLLKVVK